MVQWSAGVGETTFQVFWLADYDLFQQLCTYAQK